MNLDLASLLVALIGVGVALLTVLLGLFAFLWKIHRDQRADTQKLREELYAELEKLRAEFHQFRQEVRADMQELRGQVKELREQVYLLWQHIKKI